MKRAVQPKRGKGGRVKQQLMHFARSSVTFQIIQKMLRRQTVIKTNRKGLILGKCPKRRAFILFEQSGCSYNRRMITFCSSSEAKPRVRIKKAMKDIEGLLI